MSLLAPLVLAEDVLLTPLSELDPETRAGIDGADDDVAVSRPAARTPSVVIDAQAAALLGFFREPRTVADAVIRFCQPRELDPEEVLTGAFPLVQRFFASRVLGPADQQQTAATEIGERGEIGPWRALRTVARLDDMELLQARDADGRLAALKLARTREGMAAATLDNEERVLQHLADRAPGLAPWPLGRGALDDRSYLALEWCAGVDLATAAAEARAEGAAAVRTLLLAVARAYAALHGSGVCHGDVHPRNLLVDRDGRVRLIDFGLGYFTETPPPPRGGVPFYFEPEYAAAVLAGQAPAPATPAGEQYSLGALLYEAATGKPYLDFRLGREDLLGQIVADAPLAFSARGLAPWPGLEAVLHRALSKDPTLRFPSTAELAAAIAPVEPPVSRPASEPAHLAPASSFDRFVESFLAEAAEDGPWMRQGLVAPSASINYGAAGLALGLLRLAERRTDPVLLARAEAWLERAEAAGEEAAGFVNASIEITPEVVGESSPYHSPAGVAAVRARLCRGIGDSAGQAAAVRAFLERSRRPPAGDDLTLGRSAIVLGAALVLDALPAGASEREAVLALGREQLAEVWGHLDGEPAIAASAIDNLGIAHGWAGFAYAALQWHRASGDPPPAALSRRLDELARLAEPAGRGLEWRWQLRGERLVMPGWCNGSAGHVLLWTLAHRHLGEPGYLDLALGAGWNVWEPSRTGTVSLCCGLAGRGYALLALYRATGERPWLERARELARAGVRAAGHEDPTYRHALWKGDLGLVTLIADLDAPEEAALPWFEDEAW